MLRLLSCRRAPCENVVHAKNTSFDPYLSPETMHACDLCSFVSNDISILNSHKHRKHGYKNPARGYVVDNRCAACLRLFHDREKAFKHLAYGNPKCLLLLQSIYHPMPNERVDELDKAAVLLKTASDKSRSPSLNVMTCSGPHIHIDMNVTGGKRQYD